MSKAYLLVILALGGCASQPSLEELEDQALISGDWSEVERYEQSAARNSRVAKLSCPNGSVSVCRESGLTSKCSCQPTKGRRTPGPL